MDPILNPFAPGAGTRPPELTGRGKLLETVRIAVERSRRRLPAQGILMVGLRGVGKTVLLEIFREQAEAGGNPCISIEAPEGRSLPALLLPQIRSVLLRLSRDDRARDKARRALAAVAGFVKALKVKYLDMEVTLDVPSEPGLADSGDFEADLQDVLLAAGEAAAEIGAAVVLLIDELQYVDEGEFGALVTALHRCAQRSVPVILIGAGLPTVRGLAGKAKSDAERLFLFPEVGALDSQAAEAAICRPLAENGVAIEEKALARLLRETEGYPYFLQEWGKQVWDVATASPITESDVRTAADQAMAALDAGFFRVRVDRLTPLERRYLRAMADLGPGPHRSGDIAEKLGRPIQSLAPVRAQLMLKGMVWSPGHGDTAFTVPLFDSFLRRTIPAEGAD
jgi:hypothetical protein